MTSKPDWESIKPEQRAGLIAAAIVLLLFPFWFPSGFLAAVSVTSRFAILGQTFISTAR